MSFERKNIAKMQGYVPGEQPKDRTIVKLNTNENPYPASPAVADALANIDVEDLRRYPQAIAEDFRQIAADVHGVDAENIIPTNGGDELLRLALTTFVEARDKVIVTQPTYSLYPVLAEVQNCNLEEIALRDDWTLPTDFRESLNRSRAKMCILVNPHAPTGSLLSSTYIEELAESFKGVLGIVEAYVDFVDPAESYNCVPLIDSHQNILILRTLSKGYSLAGLRFGYGISNKSLANPIMFKTRDSYNTDHVSQILACAALQAQDSAQANWEKIRNSRSDLIVALNELGLVTGASQTNFVLAQVPTNHSAINISQALKDQNILVRHFQQPRLEDKLRISIGTEKENKALLRALKGVLHN